MISSVRLELESGIASLEVRRVSAHDRISQLFVADVLARSIDPQIDLDAIVGKGAGVAGETASGLLAWTGVCSYMEQLKPAEERIGHSTYLLRIVPSMWLLTQRRNHRIYQHQTTPDIVKKVLGEFRIEPTLELTGEYPRHEYCVQYGESDFAFVSRLLEQAGISYFFRRQKMGEKARSVLVLSDAPQRGESIGAIQYYDTPNEGDLKGPYITDVQLAHGVRGGKVTVRDFDFRKPRLSILDSSSFPLQDGEKLEEKYEQYHYLPGVSLFEADSADDKLDTADDKSIARHLPKHNKAWAEREAEATRHQKRRLSFRSNHASLAPSKIFSVDHHPRTQLDDQSLMVVEADTFIFELDWAVVGTAVFAEVPYRPLARTPKPRVAGIQTAMVVGPPGREIHTDEFGRVRVRFHWDREGEFDDNATCWLRVSHAWAGTSFGTMHVPRIGQEVIVDFLDGDPDQPFVVGRVFNSTTRVPRKLPNHKTQSIWRSATSPQTDGKFNEIMFDDAAGKELYFLQAERDLLRLTKRNDTERTGEDRTIVVGEGRVSAIAASDSLQVGKQHLVKMVKTGDLHIGDMGDPEVQPLDTFVEMVDRKITLTTGTATIQLDGPNITIDAKGGLRFTTDGRLIMKGSMVYLNVMPGQVQPRADATVKDAVAKPDRMIGSVKQLFWQPYLASVERREQDVSLMPRAMPPQLKGDKFKGKYLSGDLFVDGASGDDVVQGQIGDCYLAAAMSAVAHARPDIITGMMKPTPDGKVDVGFRKGVDNVTVDTEVPVSGGFFGFFSKPRYMKAKDSSETWPSIMEKAYAEQFGMGQGYEGIGHGDSPGTAMGNITGGSSNYQPISAKDMSDPTGRKTVLDMLSRATDKPTVASTPAKVASGRVVGNHAYTVLGTGTDAAGNDVVKLRNPWGGSGKSGTFEMPVEHFAEDFTSLHQNHP